MADIPLNIRMRVTGDVKKALLGVQKEATKAEKEIRKDLKRTADMRKKGYQENEMAMRSSVGRQRQIMRKAAIETRNENKRTSREQEENMVRAAKRGSERARTILKAAGVLGAAGLVAGRRAFQTARGITGAPTIEQNIANAKQFDMRMAVLQNQAQLSGAQTKDIQSQVLAQGSRGTLSPTQILAGVEAVQRLEGADAIPRFLESMNETAMFAEGLGANFESLAKLSTILERQFGIMPDQMGEAIGLMAEAGVQGSVEIEDFAQQFPRVMGMFSQMLERGGMQGAQEFAAVSQAVATMFPDAPEQASRATRALVMQLSKGKTRQILGKRGIDVKRDTIPEIARRLSDKPLTDAQMEKAFPETLARGALVALLGQFKPGADNVLNSVLGAGGSGQLARARGNTLNVRGTSLGQDMMRANQMNARMVENFAGTAAAALRLTKKFDELASTFPGSTLIGRTVAEFLGALGGLTIAMKIASRGTTAATTTAATTAATTTAAAGGGSVAGAIGAIAVPALAAGAIAGGASFGGNVLLQRTIGGGVEGAEARRQKHLDFLGIRTAKDLSDAAAATKSAAQNLEAAAERKGRSE